MEPEIIQSIEDLDNFEFPKDTNSYRPSYEGFKVVTNKQEILFGIDNISGCCESWGHIASNDNLAEFVGAELLGVTETDTALVTHEVLKDLYSGGSVFITLQTSRGPLQFAVYNAHNGYYGHSVRLQCNSVDLGEMCV